jgi:hypothetical protein
MMQDFPCFIRLVLQEDLGPLRATGFSRQYRNQPFRSIRISSLFSCNGILQALKDRVKVRQNPKQVEFFAWGQSQHLIGLVLDFGILNVKYRQNSAQPPHSIGFRYVAEWTLTNLQTQACLQCTVHQ